MKILFVTDYYKNDTNGVNTILEGFIDVLNKDHTIKVLRPDYIDMLGKYVANPGKVAKMIDDYEPDIIHMCNDMAICRMVARYCEINNKEYTASYGTHYSLYDTVGHIFEDENVLEYKRHFYNNAKLTLVPTDNWVNTLQEYNFKNVYKCKRFAVDSIKYNIVKSRKSSGIIFAGRIDHNRNLDDILTWDGETKLAGPVMSNQLDHYIKMDKFEGNKILGKLTADELNIEFNKSKVLVFPCRNEAFGLVMLEAMAAGIPVVAYAGQPGPDEIIINGVNGLLSNEHLHSTISKAMKMTWNRQAIRDTALQYTWKKAAGEWMKYHETF